MRPKRTALLVFVTLVVLSGVGLAYALVGDGPLRGQAFIAAAVLVVISSFPGRHATRNLKAEAVASRSD